MILIVRVPPNESAQCVFEPTVFVDDERLIFVLRHTVVQNGVVAGENGDVNRIVRILIGWQSESVEISGKDGREAKPGCVLDGRVSQRHVLSFRDDLHPNGFVVTVSHVGDAVIRAAALGTANLTHLFNFS